VFLNADTISGLAMKTSLLNGGSKYRLLTNIKIWIETLIRQRTIIW